MSLLGSRSAKKKAAAAAAPAPQAQAPAPAKRGVVVEKQPADIYTVLLVLAFVAIVIGCVCLYAEMNVYDLQIKPR